ncbi:MAG: site-specific integrase [Acidimicrobiia bacterium]
MATTKRRRIAPGVYELERGLYELVVSRGAGPDGKYRQKTKRFHGTAAEAKKARARLLAQADSDPATSGAAPSAMTFAELLRRHIKRVGAMGASPHTVSDYRGMARNHLLPVFGNVPIDQLRTLDFDAFYDDLTTIKLLRPASIRKIHNLARGALRQAVRWGLVPTNVVAIAAPPTIRRAEIRVPSPEDVQKLIVAADEPWATLLRVAVGTGLRRGELVALRWSDVDLDEGTLRVRAGLVVTDDGILEKATKTDRVRVLSLGAATREVLRAHHDRAVGLARLAGGVLVTDAFVFASSRPGNTEALRPDSVTQMFDRLRRQVGLDGYRFHALRHFHATQLVAAGVDVRTVAGRLGHASPAVTLSVYSAFLPVRDREAADVIDRIIGP